MTRCIILFSAALGLAGGIVQAQTLGPQTVAPPAIAPPPSPLLLQPLAPGAPDIAPSVAAPPAPVAEVAPDIADLFRSEVSAVVGTGASSRVLLARTETYGRAGRSLKLGDVYQDGWKIVSMTPKAVGLARNGETRLIDLTVAGRAALSASAAADAASRRTVITTGSLGMVAPAPPPEDPALADASQAQSAAAGADPAAVAALVQSLILLGAQTQ